MDRRLASKEWRISHLYKIKNKLAELVQFKPNRAQRDFEKNRHTRNIILKSRQLGFTTDEAVDMLDDTLFHRNFDALFIAQDLDTAKDIFGNKIDLSWTHFPLQHLYRVNTDSARQLKFDFGDKTVSSVSVDSSGRSGTFQRLHITEFAKVAKDFPDKAKEILTGSIPAVPIHGRVDIESTANGSEGQFYDLFWEAWERGEPTSPSQFKAHFYNWTYDDDEMSRIEIRRDLPKEMRDYQAQHGLTDLQISYYYEKFLSLNKKWDDMKREYPTTVFEAFEGSGAKLFDSQKLNLMTLATGNKVGQWVYYAEPIIGHRYAMGCDVAEGVGQDSSTCVIWDFTPLKPVVVAIFKDNTIAPDIFAYEVKNGAEKYSMALVAVERNNHGHTTISKLKEIYPEKNIYIDDKDKLGWDTNLVSKPKMMYDLSTAINNELVNIPSQPLVSELRRYDKEQLNTTRFDDLATQHWDLLVACSIGFQMKDHRPRNEAATTYNPGFVHKA
jgi:hypothetical protein